MAGDGEQEHVEVGLGAGLDALVTQQVDEVGVELAAGLGELPYGASNRRIGNGEGVDVTQQVPCPRGDGLGAGSAKSASIAPGWRRRVSGTDGRLPDPDLPDFGAGFEVVPGVGARVGGFELAAQGFGVVVVDQDEALAGGQSGVAREDPRVPLAVRDLADIDDRRMVELATCEQGQQVRGEGGQVGAGQGRERGQQDSLLGRQVNGQDRLDHLGHRRPGDRVVGGGERVDAFIEGCRCGAQGADQQACLGRPGGGRMERLVGGGQMTAQFTDAEVHQCGVHDILGAGDRFGFGEGGEPDPQPLMQGAGRGSRPGP